MSQIPDSYVVRKQRDGWIICNPKTYSLEFLTNEQLAKKGLIKSQPESVSPPKSGTKVIIVPTKPPP